MELQKLFAEHLQKRKATTGTILVESGFAGIVIDAGVPDYYFQDDQTWSHRPNHHFAHWCPIAAPGSLILYIPGKQPVLYFVSPHDYWHDSPELGPEFWRNEFDIKIVETEADAWSGVRGQEKLIYLGSRKDQAQSVGLVTDFDLKILAKLNWERSFKSAYEIECTLDATKKAARGHRAAKAAFEAGASEREIYIDYLNGTGDLEREMPYGAIVCLDEKSSILHYTQQRKAPRDGKVLLIDAGAQTYRYASDITRTHYKKDCPVEFRRIVDGVDELQQAVSAAAVPGNSMVDLHRLAHEKIADLLIDVRILKGVDRAGALEKGLTNVFFPHGIGHMLGIFVHDVAGKQMNRDGDPVPTKHLEKDAQFKYLRSHRMLETGNLVTVEPGVYFIPLLLDPQRRGVDKDYFNWELIDQLKGCGGVRIEDDVLVTEAGNRNLTREIFA